MPLHRASRPFRLLLTVIVWSAVPALVHAAEPANARRPQTDEELRSWLQNMVWHHGFSADEMSAATGLTAAELESVIKRFEIRPDNAPPLPTDRVFTLPYPGGRHPRIGFLDGAVDPQRETKVSVFTPWHQPGTPSYVVVDCPEAVWSNLGLTYLAHTHVPTIWTQQGISLPVQEWTPVEAGALMSTRRLPNGIEFSPRVDPRSDHVALRLTLHNGTTAPLSDLRVQMCVMLKGAPGFDAQTNDNKQAINAYACVCNAKGDRWIISAWKPNHRTWFNPPCPCLHSDPKFPDLAPGETGELHGWLSFYEGEDIQQEIARLERLQWWQP